METKKVFQSKSVVVVISLMIAIGIAITAIASYVRSYAEDGVEPEVEEELYAFKDYFGLPFSVIADSKLEKYIDFYVPYEWYVEEMIGTGGTNDEAWALFDEGTAMNIYLQRQPILRNSDDVYVLCDMLRNEVANQIWEDKLSEVEMTADNMARFKVDYDGTTFAYFDVIGLESKTLLIRYVYNLNDAPDAEMYYESIIEQIKGVVNNAE